MVSLQFITHLGNFSLIEKEYPWGSNFQEDRMNIWQVLLLSQLWCWISYGILFIYAAVDSSSLPGL